jgi:cysteinyl-tRNA synthetase
MMVLKLYNTLSRKKEIFKPIKAGEVGMYVCGPTVNDVPHLGHARLQIVFDVLRKYLEFSKYKVNFVSNITDIEDKIINKANELGISIQELTEKNINEHKEDYKKLGVKSPDIQPRATEYVQEMTSLIKELEKKGYTYIIPDDGVYYKVSKFKDYGKLSKLNFDELKNKRQLKDSTKGIDKRDARDFVVWKFSKPNEPSWSSPWGNGRPGWHIECSAMTHKILGNPFDIHGGGQDLIFPHHEDEIAQSEVGYGKKMANYWVHNGMINVNKIKMSKSLGNFQTIKNILKDYSGEIIRYFVLSSHYRKPMDFSIAKLNEAKISLNRLKNIISEIEDDKTINEKYLDEFKKEINDDLNTPNALQVLWKLVRDTKAKGKSQTIKEIDKVFGLKLLEKEKLAIPNNIREMLNKRDEARKNKDWASSDKIRDEINKLGFEILDSPEGSKLKKIN